MDNSRNEMEISKPLITLFVPFEFVLWTMHFFLLKNSFSLGFLVVKFEIAHFSESTHGTKANRQKMPPKQYIRMHIGWVLSFGRKLEIKTILKSLL